VPVVQTSPQSLSRYYCLYRIAGIILYSAVELFVTQQVASVSTLKYDSFSGYFSLLTTTKHTKDDERRELMSYVAVAANFCARLKWIC
jgi:hypothetical protein